MNKDESRRGAGGPADKEMDRLLRRTMRARVDERPQGVCLEAETLAAWTDGSLTATERAAAETHAADCDRCLAVLAAIAKTSPPPSAIQRPSWLSIRWLVPLTTVAVAMTAWVLIQGPPWASIPPPAAPASVALKPAEPDLQRERSANTQALADAPGQQVVPRRGSRSTDQAKSRRAAESVAKDSAAEAKRLDAVTQAQTPASKSRPASPASSTAAAAPVPPPAPARPEALEERVQSQARMAAEASRMIVSPDPSMRWRIVGRSVERSTDGGRTWRVQLTGTTVDLLAGSSPARTVCWIVGGSGLVLLSTDGETWRRLASPDATADLVSVAARDGVAATVTTTDSRRYTTADAGGTWRLEKNP